jgi:hypothetical protein
MLNRRHLLHQLVLISGSLPLLSLANIQDQGKWPAVKVYKSPTCGCCGKWVTHLQNAGFEVSAEDVADVGVYKQEYGLPRQLASCHTAIVGGYVVEGHVPAEDVQRLLTEQPDIVGIAVPGMPMGSPGMESPNPENYATLVFTANGDVSVWAQHGPDA